MSDDLEHNDLNPSEMDPEGDRRLSTYRMVVTAGIYDFAEKMSCYWLIDEIRFVLFPQLMQKFNDWFYGIRFYVHSDKTATITVDDGNHHVLLEHKIEWTDFPITERPVVFYLCESEDCYCLMLRNEY